MIMAGEAQPTTPPVATPDKPADLTGTAAAPAAKPEEKITPAVVVKPPPAGRQGEPTAKDWGALLAREQEITKRAKWIKDQEAQLKPHLESIAEMQRDPYAWAEKNGISYEAWTKQIIAKGGKGGQPGQAQNPEILALAQKVDKLVDVFGNQIKSTQEREQQAIAQRELARLEQEFEGIVKAQDYEPIREYAKFHEATQFEPFDLRSFARSLAVKHYETYGQDLTMSELADTIRTELQGRLGRVPDPVKKAIFGQPSNQPQQQTQQPVQQSGTVSAQDVTTGDMASLEAKLAEIPRENRYAFMKANGML